MLRQPFRIPPIAWYAAGTVLSLGLIVGSFTHALPMDPTEVLGFVSGALCVWLTVRQNIWNWPIGIANSVFFVILFLQSRLYADMSLQVVYIVLGVLGWYWWLHGGPIKAALRVSRITVPETAALAALGLLCTAAMTVVLTRIADTAPFWDALTTVMSLVAQYLLTRKRFENWHVWIAADVIYVALYAYKQLFLTAGLYGIFIAMCVAGLRQWRQSLRTAAAVADTSLGEVA